MRVMRFLFGASLVGAGAVAIACSSSSGGPSGGSDAAADTSTSSGSSSSSGGSSTSSSSGMAEAAPCMPIAANPGTLDGGALWACYQAACKSQLAACAADCLCNTAFDTALQAIAMMGQSSATSELTTASGVSTAAGNVGTCLLQTQTSGACGAPAAEGGTEGGGSDAAKTGDAPTGG
jgi:hypothetical protein